VTELERALVALGRELDLPAAPDLAAAVRSRLVAPSARRSWFRRRALVLAAAVLVVALAAALAIPSARSALLELFGLRGATIERVERLPALDPATGRRLGAPVSLERARESTSFRPLVPAEQEVRVFLDRAVPGAAVTFLWDDRRLLLTEFRGESTPYVQKSAGRGTRIEYTEVNGGIGYWLAGQRHVVVFRDAGGGVREVRLAGNVLLWEQGELTLRLEGARSKAEALEIAGTLRPAPV